MVTTTAASKRSFRKRLLRWFDTNKRSFPWRELSDPYLVLIAEMMLRRTRANQVAPVYERFVRDFPTPRSLYEANSGDVKGQLQSLGLDWRIRQFEALARELVEECGGWVPETREELVRLTGVSDYVADAVLVFGFGRQGAVIDVNVARVITRYFGLREHAEARRNRQVRDLSLGLLDRKRARDYNFAMLDLAAMVCTAVAPKHSECPLRRTCVRAKQDNASIG